MPFKALQCKFNQNGIFVNLIPDCISGTAFWLHLDVYCLHGGMPMSKKPERPTVEVAKPTYQPSKAELEADLRVNATFDQAIKALTEDVNVKHVEIKKSK